MCLTLPELNQINFICHMIVDYVAGFLSKSILSKITNCSTCKSELTNKKVSNPLIEARQYLSVKYGLYNPSTVFFHVVKNILTLCSYYINNIFYKSNIASTLFLIIKSNIEFPFSCNEHDLKNIIINKIIALFLHTYCKNINRILKGLDTCQHPNDQIKKIAIDYYKKHSKKYKLKKF